MCNHYNLKEVSSEITFKFADQGIGKNLNGLSSAKIWISLHGWAILLGCLFCHLEQKCKLTIDLKTEIYFFFMKLWCDTTALSDYT